MNVKTFNKVMGKNYHTELLDGMDGYNKTLEDKLNEVINRYKTKG